MSHAHHKEGRIASQRRLAITLALAASYAVAEVVGGILSGSLALLADAGHMLSDVFALTLSLVALRVAQRPVTPQRTYGYHRTEILAALAQGVLLVVVSIAIFVHAYERLATPQPVLAGPMLLIATGGLLVNLVGLAVLRGSARDNLNVRGAFLHVASDALGSVGAMLAGTLIWAFGWLWADAVVSLGIGALIIRSSWFLLREAVEVLMEGAPARIDVVDVQRSISRLAGVVEVHDLHVWTITSGMVALSGHVVVEEDGSHGALLQQICDLLAERFGIEHSTIQIEPPGFTEPGIVC